jgi:hypothetical protein
MEVRSDYPLPSPLRLDLGTVDNPPQHSDRARTARDHLKIYYSDFLRVPTAHGLAYMDQKESLVDCEELLAWTAQAQPRSRVDAFPLLAICRDLLSRMSKKELKLSSRRIKELEAELAQAHATIEVQAAELNELRAGHVRAIICYIDSSLLPYTRKAKRYKEKDMTFFIAQGGRESAVVVRNAGMNALAPKINARESSERM